jgi:glyoxylase-like metal-dependent hydrolase (beta-lactamase superfamily II)
MNKLILLEIEMSYGETMEEIHPVVLKDDANCVIVDCGYVGSLGKLEEALHQKDILPEEITHIILTHQDHDHVGAAAAFKRKYSGVRFLSSAEEAPYIAGTYKSLRLEQAEQLQEVLPENMQEFGKAFCNLLRSVEPVPIDQIISDGERLPYCGGCEVLLTAGHTPGHISLFLPEFDTIIAGDSIALEDGKPVVANPQFTLDMEKATESMQRLLEHPSQQIICYHGGILVKDSEHNKIDKLDRL